MFEELFGELSEAYRYGRDHVYVDVTCNTLGRGRTVPVPFRAKLEPNENGKLFLSFQNWKAAVVWEIDVPRRGLIHEHKEWLIDVIDNHPGRNLPQRLEGNGLHQVNLLGFA